MKNMKKLFSLLLAIVMVMGLAVSANAAVVNNTSGHTYDAYQIFSGTQADGSTVLGDIEWGSGVSSGDDLLAALQADARFGEGASNIFAACTTAKEVAEVLAANNAAATTFANLAAANLSNDATATTIAADATSAELAAGYYLLVDTTDVDGKNDAKNSALLQVTNDTITINKKYDVPSPDKDITGVTHIDVKTNFTGAEAVDAEIGDTIEFTLTGTLPTNYDDYETYVYNFHDTLSAGMTYVANSAKVYVVNGSTSTEVTSSFTVSTTGCDCGCNLKIACSDLKAITGVTITKDSVIKVVYSATLDSDAVLGSTGNPNDMYIEYSNNPNDDGDGEPDTGDTPKDEVLVFTYELDTTKVDGKNADTKLSGAEFVLLNSEKAKVATVVNGKLTGWADVPDAGTDGKITWPENTTLTSDANGKFIVQGLDAATYYLRETKAPAGYNLLTADVKIIITATVTPADGTEGEAKLEALKIKVGDGAETDGTTSTGVVNATIENNQGGTLPETGGMGTTMLYTIGGILVVAAVVLLVTKKRMGAAE